MLIQRCSVYNLLCFFSSSYLSRIKTVSCIYQTFITALSCTVYISRKMSWKYQLTIYLSNNWIANVNVSKVTHRFSVRLESALADGIMAGCCFFLLKVGRNYSNSLASLLLSIFVFISDVYESTYTPMRSQFYQMRSDWGPDTRYPPICLGATRRKSRLVFSFFSSSGDKFLCVFLHAIVYNCRFLLGYNYMFAAVQNCKTWKVVLSCVCCCWLVLNSNWEASSNIYLTFILIPSLSQFNFRSTSTISHRCCRLFLFKVFIRLSL